MDACQRIACVAALIGLWFSCVDALAQHPLFQTNRTALQVSASNSSVIVSWPLSPIESILETTIDPQTGAWAAVTNSPSATDDYVHVATPPGESSRFFRLNGNNCVPIFQFAAFYDIDLEIGIGPTMTITGPVHCNSNLYADPSTSLTFQKRVTAGGNIFEDKAPGDPITRSNGPVYYLSGKRSGVEPLWVPIGTNSMRQIAEIPPVEENPSSALGLERFYNKADLIILVRDAGTIARSGSADSFRTVLPTNEARIFLTNSSFYNRRENKTIRATQIDIGRLGQWNATNTLLRPVLLHSDIRVLYVADLRTQGASTQSGIRLVNGHTMLPKGLTIATPNPLYVQGHYNCPVSAHLGTTNTSATLPAALIGDAITILSSTWNDANSTRDLSSRVAANTTVNACFLGGIVPTGNGYYSGGLENFPRLLENWAGKTLTYNGSMVVLWTSQIATSPWGAAIGIYNPPVRQWGFDSKFNQIGNLPPATPVVGVIHD